MKGREGKQEKVGAILMQKYELGKLLGQGTFAKVYHARNIKTGMNVAVKIINKEKVVKVGLIDQIKREISVMRLVKHPNVVRLYEVMASKTKIYFAMEYVKGGELFNKVARGRLKEDAARNYFQQLMAAVDFCHSRGVYHRDLKPENLLLDELGNLKVSDFGLSALHDSRRQDGLLHTTCGTPAYVAPEVINKKGYDGEKADIWSCGVILFVLLAGYLPFHDKNLMEMYKKISKAEFRCPQWFPPEVKKLLSRILDPNPNARMTLIKIMDNSWFKKGFKEIQLPNEDDDDDDGDDNDDVEEFRELSPRCILEIDHDIIDHHSDHEMTPRGNHMMKPTCLNAFDIISLSQGFNLSGLFEDEENHKPESRFTTTMPPSVIVEKLEEVAAMDSFKVKMKDGMVKLQGNKGGRKGSLAIDAQIFEVTPSLHVVEVKKRAGDTLEYRNFCDHELRPSLKDIASTWHQGCTSKEQAHS